jgi:hypothetical protein
MTRRVAEVNTVCEALILAQGIGDSKEVEAGELFCAFSG